MGVRQHYVNRAFRVARAVKTPREWASVGTDLHVNRLHVQPETSARRRRQVRARLAQDEHLGASSVERNETLFFDKRAISRRHGVFLIVVWRTRALKHT